MNNNNKKKNHHHRGASSTNSENDNNILILKEESNFWYTTTTNSKKEEEDKLPSHNNLDTDGPLPDDCYYKFDNNENPSSFCRIGIDLSQNDDDDDDDLLNNYLHKCIDCGLTTFYGGTPTVYRNLISDTPQTVLDKCNLVTSVFVPEVSSSSFDARELLLSPLYERGSNSIDTIQLHYNYKSIDYNNKNNKLEYYYYFMEILNVASDLQREGIIRSIVGHRIPLDLLEEIKKESADIIESNQLPSNVLNPYSEQSSDNLVFDNTLAGGLLSHQYYYKRRKEPFLYELSNSVRENLNDLYQWSSRGTSDKNTDNRWNTFQKNIMDVLYDLSNKYSVSSSIDLTAMRYALQMTNNVKGIVVDNNDNDPERLRRLFEFHLEDDDIDRLWEASRCLRSEDVEEGENYDDDDYYERETTKSGLFLP